MSAKPVAETIRVLRVYHAGRDPGHRRRDRELVRAGVDLHLVVPDSWPGPGGQDKIADEPFAVHELSVTRSGDVNRHRYTRSSDLESLVRRTAPDVVDIHEEPFSLAARQWLSVVGDRPVVMYTAQNLDKRFPPPFAQYELSALNRVQALYPCSRQAASVARGKGFRGRIHVLPLGYDPDLLHPGTQRHDDAVFTLGLVGRMVREKGVREAVRVLAAIRQTRPARLLLLGSGPEVEPALALAEHLGVRDLVEHHPWLSPEELATHYRRMHLVLVPSSATATWVEQFGRVIVEAQAAGAPVVGYDSGSIAETLGHDDAVVQEGDVSGLISKVGALVGDSGLWSEFRTRGILRIRDMDWRSVAARQVELYAAALRDRPGSTPTALRADLRNLRDLARGEFGSPARTLISGRPVALPGVRESQRLDSAVGTVVDRAVRLRERIGRTASRTVEHRRP